MKKRIGVWAVVGIGLLLAGCVVPSVYPFFTEKDLVFDEALIGSWVKASGEDKTEWKFEKSGAQEYKLTVEDDKPAVYAIRLFKFDGQMFMDSVPEQKIAGDLPGIPSHYLLKVQQIQPTLKWSTFNYKSVTAFLEKNPHALRHIFEYGDPKDADTKYVVLTAETKELQQFVRKHLDDTNMFMNVDEMKPAAAKETH